MNDVVINNEKYDVETIVVSDSNGEQKAFYPDAVRYNEQSLTDAQKAQARKNIGAESAENVVKIINEKISEQTNLRFEIVDELPVRGEENIIYLVRSDSSEDNQYFDEYMFLHEYGRFEKIGNTKVDLSQYYQSSYIDYLLETLEAAIKREIPTKTSQLENNSGFINGTGLQAAIDELKDYFFDEEEVTIEWDGNTTGREVYEMKGSITGTFYKVSDIVVKAEDIVGCTYYTKVGGDTEKTVPARGTGALFGLYDNDYSWILIAAGMVCLYDDSQGCSPGLYFRVGPYEYDNSKTEFVTKLIVEHDKIKTELLPENIGGGSVESVNRKTGAVVLTAEDVGALPNTTKIPKKISDLENDEGYLKNYTETDPTVPAWAKNPTKPQYTASEVGADPSGTAAGKVAEHDTSTEAHNDIRLLIQGLTTRLNALANSDDTTLDQMAEVVAYIKSNRTLIESVTTGKVSVTDIIDNLTTNVADKPLSAAQGAKLKDLIDDITVPTKTSQLTNDSKFMSADEVVSKINEAISGVAGGLKFEIVDAIDTSELGDSNTIYLVPSEDTDSDNLQYYDEYMFIEGSWEKLGDTRVNLDGYYTEIEVDNLLTALRKTIPIKTSQLINDSNFVKASELETGEATWDSLKGNIIERVGTPVTWDGNTTGREVYEMKGSITGTFYKVSDIVVKAEDIVGCTYYTKVGGDTEKTVPARGTGALFGLYDNEYCWILIAGGMVCLYDDSQGCSPGIYFAKNHYEYDNSKTEFVTKLIVEHDKIKPELLPDIMETVGSDTLTWDGNTDGKKIFDLSFMDSSGSVPEGGIVIVKISDSVPTIDQLNMGLSLTVIQESEDSANVYEMVCDTFYEFDGLSGVYNNSELSAADGGYSMNQQLVSVVTDDVTLPNGTVVEKGTYFVRIDIGVALGGGLVGLYLYASSVTFNGYTEFNKRDVIKEEYLPQAPFFDLVEMGLPPVVVGGESSVLEVDTTEIEHALRSGMVSLRVMLNESGMEMECVCKGFESQIMGAGMFSSLVGGYVVMVMAFDGVIQCTVVSISG